MGKGDWRINGKMVCTGTHPKQPNKSGTARGRKVHLSKDGKTTSCNLLVDECLNRYYDCNTVYMWRGRQCKNCFTSDEAAQLLREARDADIPGSNEADKGRRSHA